jgi:hypothetical protein
MPDNPEQSLSPGEQGDLRRLAGIMVPASTEYRLPGADDAVIFADIIASLGRDEAAVRQALAELREIAGTSFATLDPPAAERAAMALLGSGRPTVVALGRAVLQCYYRDERVHHSLGREPGPPFPKGHALPSGDWSLLDVQRARPRMWRDLDSVDRGGRSA